MHPLRTHYDKLLLGLSILVLGASLDWVRRQQAGMRQVRSQVANPALAGGRYEPEQRPELRSTRPVWSEPGAQSAGEGWLYEVFTPPAIFYDPASRSFTVSPGVQSDGGDDGSEFAVSLLEVKQEPYRLQLAGYFGKPDDYLVAFVSASSADPHLVRVGHRFADLELTLKHFSIRKVLVATDESGPVYEAAAQAVLHDEREDRDVLLDSRERRFTDTPLAVLALPGEAGRWLELREGDSFGHAETAYRIERIQLEPAGVHLSRMAPGSPAPEMRVLRPRAPPASAFVESESGPYPTGGHAAIHGQ